MIIPWRCMLLLLLSRFSRVQLCDPIDGSPPGSSVPGILQARTLEWVAISFSNAWKRKVKVKSLSRVRLLVTPWTTAHQAPPSMEFSKQEYCSGVAMSFSRGSSQLRDWTQVSHHCRQMLYHLSHQGSLTWDKVCLIHYWVPTISLPEVRTVMGTLGLIDSYWIKQNLLGRVWGCKQWKTALSDLCRKGTY